LLPPHEKLVSINFLLQINSIIFVVTIYFLDSKLNQIRRKLTPTLPTSVDFDIAPQYKKTTTGERFLLADRVQRYDGEVHQRLIVFATDEQLRTLFTSDHIFMDGTFDSVPAHFHQVYSIHALKNDYSKLFHLS